MSEHKPRLADNEVIAERVYLITGSKAIEKVIVRLSGPRKKLDENRYECGVEIAEPGRTSVRYMNGVDAFEALQLAVIIIGTDLKHINEQLDGALRWDGGTRQDLAFPSYPDYSLWPIMRPPKNESGLDELASGVQKS